MKRISHNQAQAIYNALLDDNLWMVFTIEFPEAAKVIERSMGPQEPQPKRVVAIGKGEHVTYVNADWELYSGSIYDNLTLG